MDLEEFGRRMQEKIEETVRGKPADTTESTFKPIYPSEGKRDGMNGAISYYRKVIESLDVPSILYFKNAGLLSRKADDLVKELK